MVSSPCSLCVLGVLPAPPPAPRAQVGATTSPFLTVDEARRRGVEFRQANFATEMKYPFETLGGAVAAFDFDDDGWVILLFLNGAPSPGARAPRPRDLQPPVPEHGERALRRRDGGVGAEWRRNQGIPAAVGDYDNDGYPDVLVTNYGDNVLYANGGNRPSPT